MKTDVLIAGAGPTGLALACQLIRYNIDFVILDKKQGTTPYSKAIGVQARTLEIYEQIDLAQKLIGRGAIAEGVRLVEGGAVRGEVNLKDIGTGLSPYPFLLLIEQGEHEKILYDQIKAQGKDVLWNTQLENISQNEDAAAGGVTATVKTNSGARDIIEAKYLVGADGAKSFVRNNLGLKFEGSTFERLFYVADVQIDWQLPHDSLVVCLAQNTITAFFPMPASDKHFRIVGTFPENSDATRDEGEILYEEIERQIKIDTELELDIHDVNWFSVYRVHTRHVERFSAGRCFLAGDAAHIHTPAGAQGMNTGIQDGYNLAWKLAMVLRGEMSEKLLETYNEERLENAKELLKTTDRLFQFGASPDAFVSFFRTQIFPHLAGYALSLDTVKKFVFPRVSQIGINYRKSSLSETPDGNFTVKPGDRMPYFEIEGASVYRKLKAPMFHLLTFSDGRNRAFDFPENEFSGSMDFHRFPLYPHVAETFGSRETFSVLLRPDNYIGAFSTAADGVSLTNFVRNYLKR